MAYKVNYFRIGLLLSFLVITNYAWTQTEHKALLNGTEAYQKGDYTTATKSFKSALLGNSQSTKANFNLGNSYYKREKFEEATTHYQNAIGHASSDLLKSKAFYNLGNSYLAQAKKGMTQQPNTPPQLGKKGEEQLKNAIDAYKNALRTNTADYDAKNNLGMAYKMLRQEQQKQQQQQNEKQDKKDNEEDKKDKQEDQKEKEEENQNEESPADDKNKDSAKKDDDISKGKPQDMEKNDIERMLERIEEEDKRVQEKLRKRKRSSSVQIEKDW